MKFAGKSCWRIGKERLRRFYKTASDNLSRICTAYRHAREIRNESESRKQRSHSVEIITKSVDDDKILFVISCRIAYEFSVRAIGESWIKSGKRVKPGTFVSS